MPASIASHLPTYLVTPYSHNRDDRTGQGTRMIRITIFWGFPLPLTHWALLASPQIRSSDF